MDGDLRGLRDLSIHAIADETLESSSIDSVELGQCSRPFLCACVVVFQLATHLLKGCD